MRKQINIILSTEQMDVFLEKSSFPGCNDLWQVIDRTKYKLYDALVGLDVTAPELHQGMMDTPGLFFNAISDPDVNPNLLQTLSGALEGFPRNIVNHPDAVLKTTREIVASHTSEIPGWTTPRVIRIKSDVTHQFSQIVEEANLKFPIIARSVGMHSSKAILINSADDISSLGEPPKGADLYVTEYHDYQSDDGLFRKLRVFLFSTGELVARHFMVSDFWNVSGEDSRAYMLTHAALQAEEEAFLNDATSVLSEENISSLHALREKLGLDYMGADCSVLKDGTLLLFEANAQMGLGNFGTKDGNFEYKYIAKKPLQEAFTTLLEKLYT